MPLLIGEGCHSSKQKIALKESIFLGNLGPRKYMWIDGERRRIAFTVAFSLIVHRFSQGANRSLTVQLQGTS